MTEESISKKIAELFDLYKSGAISKEEYEKLKKQILSEHGIDNIENGNEQEKVNIASVDKPIQAKNVMTPKMKGVIISVVFIFVVFCFLVYLFSSKAQTVKDIDGNVYKTVTIGEQVWMKENLKTTKYNNGTEIPLVTDANVWKALTTPAYCWYANDEATNKNVYGALYNWYTANTGILCPTGWHLPWDGQWALLTYNLGGESIAGRKLKETGTTHWEINTGATNESGFSALHGGYRDYEYDFTRFHFYGSCCFWWSSTEHSISDAYSQNLYFNSDFIKRDIYNKKNGFSIRCVKD